MTASCRSLPPLSPGWSKRQDLPSALWGPRQGPLLQFRYCAMGRKTITAPPECTGRRWQALWLAQDKQMTRSLQYLG